MTDHVPLYCIPQVLFVAYWAVSLVFYRWRQADVSSANVERTSWYVLFCEFGFLFFSWSVMAVDSPVDSPFAQIAISAFLSLAAFIVLFWYFTVCGPGLVFFLVLYLLASQQRANEAVRLSVRIYGGSEGSAENPPMKLRGARLAILVLALLSAAGLVTAALQCVVTTLWENETRELARSLGAQDAVEDYDNEHIRLFELGEGGDLAPTSKLSNGIEVWRYPWYPLLSPPNKKRSAFYVDAYNSEMLKLTDCPRQLAGEGQGPRLQRVGPREVAEPSERR